jgi:hypothetical protein
MHIWLKMYRHGTLRVVAYLVLGLLGACVASGDDGDMPVASEASDEAARSDDETEDGVPAAQTTIARCCGCTCADARWSCAKETCTDERGVVTALAPEAGYFELEPGLAGIDTDARGRMFYAFQPADSAPEQRPLFVFFQGGPVVGMLPLWGGNTGPLTLDPDRTRGEPIAPNPARWSRFANLLYIDSPYAGFSYVVDPTVALDETFFDRMSEHFGVRREASCFTRVLVRFLARHPQLIANRVVLVGESYGGIRATHMLDQLLHHATLRGPGMTPPLADEIASYLARALGRPSILGFTPAQIGAHFGAVLIQPSVDLSGFTPPPRDESGNSLQPGFNMRLDRMWKSLLTPSVLRRLTGVSIESIAWMRGAARMDDLFSVAATSYSDPGAAVPRTAEAGLRALLGGVRPDYLYYRPVVYLSGVTSDRDDIEDSEDRFVVALRHVPMFITNAGRDENIDSASVLNVVASSSEVRSVTRAGRTSRIENVQVTYVDGTRRAIRFPSYPESGHAVTMFVPELIAADVQSWWSEIDR